MPQGEIAKKIVQSFRAKFLPPSPQEMASNIRRMTITTDDQDREGDIVDPGGCDYQAYMAKNPIVLFAHDYSGGSGSGTPNIIGRTHELAVDGHKIDATYEFAPTPFAQEVKTLVDGGFLNTSSIGFRSMDYEPLDPKNPWNGLHHKKWELLEWSIVPVPMNAEASAIRNMLSAARAKGLVLTEIERWVKEAATMPETITKDGEWKVGGSRGLPVDEDSSWDASAADKRVREWAGGDDKEKIDWAKFRRAFIVNDGSESFGGVKLGFADVKDGKLKAVKAGLVAARVVLNGGRGGVSIPDNVKASAKKFVDSYLGAQEEDGIDAIAADLFQAHAEIRAFKQVLHESAIGIPIAGEKRGAVLSTRNRDHLESAHRDLTKVARAHKDMGDGMDDIQEGHKSLGDHHKACVDALTDAVANFPTADGTRALNEGTGEGGGFALGKVREALGSARKAVRVHKDMTADMQSVTGSHEKAVESHKSAHGHVKAVLEAADVAVEEPGDQPKPGEPAGNPMPQPREEGEKPAATPFPSADGTLSFVLDAPKKPDATAPTFDLTTVPPDKLAAALSPLLKPLIAGIAREVIDEARGRVS